MHALRHKVALTYLGVFYITARREWVGIDRHRMDKYLLLVRRCTSHALRYCANRDWRSDVVQDIAAVFEKAALVAGTKGMVDVGLRLHISELFVGELRKVGVQHAAPPNSEVVKLRNSESALKARRSQSRLGRSTRERSARLRRMALLLTSVP